MRHVFYYYDEYTYRVKVNTRNDPLYELFEIIRDNQTRIVITVEDDENDPRKVIIWSNLLKLNLKEALPREAFKTDEEDIIYGERYAQEYALKRFTEMPAIRIFRDNYEFLEQQWKEICQRKPKYLIVREHDNGYVDIVEKDELSEQDIAIMNREHKIFQNYLKRRQAYETAHPEKLYPIWRGPEDSEFESDFALYDPIDEQGID